MVSGIGPPTPVRATLDLLFLFLGAWVCLYTSKGVAPGSALLLLLSYWGLSSALPGLCPDFVLIQLTSERLS